MARKKWRTVYPEGLHDDHPSEQAAYEFVDALRDAWVAGAPGHARAVTVQVNVGAGWQAHEYIDFTAEALADTQQESPR